MKNKLLIAALALTIPSVASAHDEWVLPAIIGGAIIGSTVYSQPAERDVLIIRERGYDNGYRDYERREMLREQIRENQLRQRMIERREYELYRW
jgi:uncharacterized protein (DUF111 family)